MPSGSTTTVVSAGGPDEVMYGVFQTVGAVNADFDFRAPWPEGRCATVIVVASGTNPARTGTAGVSIATTYNRATGGALFAASGVTIFNANNGLAGVAYTLGIAGNGARFRMSGIAGQTINWQVTLLIYNNQ